MKLGLGTVQFGLAYGAMNADGQVPEAEVARILAHAREADVDLLDTAAAYGSSEAVLGRMQIGSFRMVTKTPPLRRESVSTEDAETVYGAVRASLERLGRTRVEGLLVHHADDLLVPGGERLFDTLQRLKAEGHVERIGASVYTAGQIEGLLERYPLEIIQLPINVLDQQLLGGGLLRRLKQAGVEVHARSLFLQGIMLAPPASLPARFDALRPALQGFATACEKAGISPLAGCLAFARHCGVIDYGIVGVLSRPQLEEIILAWQAAADVRLPFDDLAMPAHPMLNPAHWPPA